MMLGWNAVLVVGCGCLLQCTLVAACSTCTTDQGECVDTTCWCVAGFGGVGCADVCNTTTCSTGPCSGPSDADCVAATDCVSAGVGCTDSQGTCMSYDDGTPGVKCQCEVNFVGDTCDLECVGGCANGGTCIAQDTSTAVCTCTADFYGTSCTERTCSDNGTLACQNEGTCGVDGECDCTAGYWGDLCHKQECDASTLPCENGGTCTETECVCEATYGGDLCNLRKCNTEVACENGGTCGADDLCVCSDNYAGDMCQNGAGRAVQTLSVLLLMATSCWLLL